MPASISTSVLFASPVFELGEFRCEPGDPKWVRTSVARSHLVAFPRTCSVIAQADREEVVATPNVAVLYNAGCEYTCRILAPAGEVTTFVRIAGPELVEAIAEFDPAVRDRPVTPLKRAACSTRAGTYFHHVALSLGEPGADVLGLEEQLYQGLRWLLQDAFACRRPRGEPRVYGRLAREYTRRAEEVLARSFRDRLTLGTLSACVGVSPLYLCRVFRAVTGTTIHAYTDALRLRTALEELADPRRRLVDVALGCGYSSQSHFTTAFGRHFGVTPGRFRAGGFAPGRFVRLPRAPARRILKDR